MQEGCKPPPVTTPPLPQAWAFLRKPFLTLFRSDTDFVALGATNNAWNVVRSEFDHLLLKHASSCGAQVYEQTRVTEVIFEGALSSGAHPQSNSQLPQPCFGQRIPLRRNSATVDIANQARSNLGRPKSVIYETVFGGKREITFDYLVDASGRAGILSTKYGRNAFPSLSVLNRPLHADISRTASLTSR